MRVVVTGAAGKIGREIADELADSHELTLIDCEPLPGKSSLMMDLSEYPLRADSQLSSYSSLAEERKWRKAFDGVEVVIHLAEDPEPRTAHQRVLKNNVQATWNVLHAAVHHRVRRVIYASSGWAVKLLEEQLAPACYTESGRKITSEIPPCPKNPYGIGKAFGELTGKCYSDTGQLESFLAVRLGWFDPNCPKDELYNHLKITAKDLRSLFRRCVEVPFTGFHVIYGVSAQKTAPYDLFHTRRLLSWEPSSLT